ncbi:MAG: hypothetical protein ACR2J3_12155 [Aridibacter sp.]
MLDTLLQIGKTLRKSGRLRHHRYIIPAPISDKKTEIEYFSVPVDEDFNFNPNKIEQNQIYDEDFIRTKLYYLKYKSADSDSSVKYMWGDIFYGVIKDKEQGYYRMEIAERNKKSSFVRGIEDAQIFKGTKIEKFRKSFEENRQVIEDFLKENSNEKFCYLHFDFGGKHWYEFEDELDAMNEKFLDEFLGKQNDKFVLRKSLYKTIASPEKNLPFPQFTAESMYKTKTFDSAEDVMDLLYAITYSTKDTLRERDIKIIVLPKGDNLEADQIEEFFERDKSEIKANTTKITEQDKAEEKLSAERKQTSFDDFFDSLFPQALFEIGENINSFDFIFSKAGGVSSPDVDMIELAGLRKSHLRIIGEEIAKIRLEVQAKRDELIKSEKLYPFDVRRSFKNILGDIKITKGSRNYYSKGVHLDGHLIKILPQIYSGTYRRDDLLLPAFIERCEFNIRSENPNFNLLKFDYEFLTRLRRNGGEKMVEMKNSDSYKIGKLLGELAQPVSWEIKSFEKNYVGLLSRRISDKQGLISFANFINEKLAIHERAYPSLKEKFGELAGLLSEIGETDYHRDYCAFGFFEGYFKKFEKPEKQPETTNLQINGENL